MVHVANETSLRLALSAREIARAGKKLRHKYRHCSWDVAVGMRKPTSFGSLSVIVSVTCLFPLFLGANRMRTSACHGHVLRCRRFCLSCCLKWRVRVVFAHEEKDGNRLRKPKALSVLVPGCRVSHSSRRCVDGIFQEDNLNVSVMAAGALGHDSAGGWHRSIQRKICRYFGRSLHRACLAGFARSARYIAAFQGDVGRCLGSFL